MMKIQKKNFILYLISGVLFIFTAYLYVGGFLKGLSLSRNCMDAKATILNFRSGTRESYYFDYNYFVNGMQYHGSGYYYPGSDLFSVGDTIEIVYDRTNSDSSMPLRDYENSRYETPLIIPAFIFIGLLIWWGYRKK